MAELRKKNLVNNWFKKIGSPSCWYDYLHHTAMREWVLVVIIFVILTALLSFDYVPQQLDVKVGERSKYDYVAPRTILDRRRTKRLMEEIDQKVYMEALRDPNNLTIDPNKVRISLQYANYFMGKLTSMRRDLFEQKERGIVVSPELLQEYAQKLNDEIYGEYNLTFDRDTVVYCLKLKENEWKKFQVKIEQELTRILSTELIAEDKIKEIRNSVYNLISKENFTVEQLTIIKNIIGPLIVPNITVDMDKVRKLQEEKKRNVEPIYIKANTPILFKDKIVTAEDIEILKDLNVIKNNSNRLLIFLCLSFLILSFIAILLVYIIEYNKKILKQERHLVLITVIVAIHLIIAKLVTLLPVSYNSWDWRYVIPVAFTSMLLTIFIDPQLVLVLNVLLSFLIGVICKGEIIFAIISLIAGSVAIFSINRFSQRGDLMRTGIFIIIVNVLSIFTLEILLRGTELIFAGKNAVLGALGGFVSSVLTIGLLPFVEHFFGVVSYFRLLELANPAHPLLKRLLLEAPGTYHHSIIVGNLAETAANAIGADAILARVGSYYHDIGKIKRPYFFTENQMGMENPHTRIAPTLSALIIISHVRDGVDLMRENKLPEAVIEVVEQHHGTDLIRYFYARATENENAERNQIRQEDFRYPGPKPRSREAALVMMADSVEAAVRAMPKPTIPKIENLVNKIIKERLDDGQFNDCNLTLKDLNLISQAFQKILNGIYHTRVQYPDISEIERKKATK